jgi:hypothetical protein
MVRFQPVTAPRSMRQFADAAGVEWQVFEVRRSSETDGAVTPGRERGWLAFSSALERRRLAPIPSDWESVAEERLADLCATAEVVVQRHDEFIRERRRLPRLTRPSGGEPGEKRNPQSGDEARPAADRAPGDLTEDTTPLAVDAVILQHARNCRANKTTVVAGMIALRRMLAERGIASGSAAFKSARRLFVTAFYFEE